MPGSKFGSKKASQLRLKPNLKLSYQEDFDQSSPLSKTDYKSQFDPRFLPDGSGAVGHPARQSSGQRQLPHLTEL